MGLPLTILTQLAPKSIEYNERMRNNFHYAVQGHSRSPILVSVEITYGLPIMNNSNFNSYYLM